MSLLWRPLQQIASWLDECPQVRVEHVPPAAKREQIKGQRNPLELEVRFLSTRPLFRQHFSGCMKQSAWNLDWGLVSGGLLASELSFQSIVGLQDFIALGTSVFYVLHKAVIHTDVEPAPHCQDPSFIAGAEKRGRRMNWWGIYDYYMGHTERQCAWCSCIQGAKIRQKFGKKIALLAQVWDAEVMWVYSDDFIFFLFFCLFVTLKCFNSSNKLKFQTEITWGNARCIFPLNEGSFIKGERSKPPWPCVKK